MFTLEIPNQKFLVRTSNLYILTSLAMWYICNWYISLSNEINESKGILHLQPDQRIWLMGFTTIYFITCTYSFILQQRMFFTWIGLIFSNIYIPKMIDTIYHDAIPPMRDTPTEFLTTGMVISAVSGFIVFCGMLLSDSLSKYILNRTSLKNKSS